MSGINVLSCFDGLGGAYFALDKAGIKVNKYYASEVDKYAIQVAMKNHPDIIQLGDIEKWREWDIDVPDIIIAGSPCQGFSIAGQGLNFEDPRSKLFFVFVDILNYWKTRNPNLKFMLENVRMKKEWEKIITEQVGVEPVLINSALVSAQNRNRLYWANWKIEQPEDRGLVLRDILEDDSEADRLKSYCIDANYWKGGNEKSYFEKGRRQLVKLPQVKGAALRNQVTKRGVEAQLNIRKDDKSNCVVPSWPHKLNGLVFVGGVGEKDWAKDGKKLSRNFPQGRRIYSDEGKATTLSAQGVGSIGGATGIYRIGTASDINGHDILKRIYSPDGKSPTLDAQGRGNREPKVSILDIREYSPKCQKQIRKNSKLETEKSIALATNGNSTGSGTTTVDMQNGVHYRKLTPLECERLQTLPDNATLVMEVKTSGKYKGQLRQAVSDTQRYKMIGNGFNIDTVAHNFSFLPKEFYTE